MSLFRRNPRRDANEAELIGALKAHGCSVEQISRRGVPDLLIGRNGRMWLAEVKSEDGELTPDQEDWVEKWRGPKPVILRTVADVEQLVRFGPAGLEG